MCLKLLRNILQPLNILGKDIQFKKFDLNKIPTEGGRRGYKPIHLVWTGGELVVTYTIVQGGGEWQQERILTPVKNIYTDGNATAISFNIPDEYGIIARRYPSGYQIFFRCTDVTYLEINGDILING